MAGKAYITDTWHSPHARLRPVSVAAVKLADRFWRPRQQTNDSVSVPSQRALNERTGRIENFRRASGKAGGAFEGMFFNDSDVYKWLEAAAWSLAPDPDPALEQAMDAVVDEIAAAQQPDGYLNTYFTGERAQLRWTNWDLHELYCAGHLIQAAIAYYRTAGKGRLLDVARRVADHICARLGPEEEGKQFGAPGHPEIEMALVELYRTTGDRKYLDQVQYFFAVRGQGRLGHPFGRRDSSYHQDHVPFREMEAIAGHAVRATYLNCGASDLYAETGEPALRAALERVWQNMVTRKMYITGGLGSRWEIEGFGQDYELPNRRAYAESCAAVGSVMWNWRMLAMNGEARYADVLEQALYNGALPGVSLDGRAYFYQNPLSDDGHHRREEWFMVACCPSNIGRLLAQLAGYFYSASDGGIWVHLYAENRAAVDLPDGRTVRLAQHTDYPWSGDVELEVQDGGPFSLFLRVPGWCHGVEGLQVNGQPAGTAAAPGSYVQLARDWQAGDRVRYSLPMPVRQVEAHPYVVEDQGRIALMRGPLLYCLEQADHPTADVRRLAVDTRSPVTAEFVPDLLNGVVVLRGSARVALPERSGQDVLYGERPEGRAEPDPARPVAFTAIPYYAWANRAPGPMEVWLPAL